MKRTISLVLVLALGLAVAGLAQAATITVGPEAAHDFDTIQAGIDATVDGDTVLVAPGEYVIAEPITFRGKAITVKSEAGRDETTIRMSRPSDPDRTSVVVFENNEAATSVLEGFTITGGRGYWVAAAGAFVGGGIYFQASSATVRNCAIVENSATNGGGVLCEAPSSPTLIDCIIAENSAEGQVGGVQAVVGASVTLTNCIISRNSSKEYCGGVSCWNESAVILTNCIIAENSAGLTGGGVMGSLNSSVTMTDCIVTGNTAVGGLGGGIHFSESRAELTNCVIARNTAGLGGGGVGCAYADSSMSIRNCTIWGNSGGSNYGGGGVGCYNGASATVTNSIIWRNTSPKGREIALAKKGSPSTLTVAYSDVGGEQDVVNVEGGCTLNWGEGNIDADPCFADAAGRDYHLKSQAGRWDPNSQTWVQDNVTSPCIDAGDPDSDWKAELWPHGIRVNMGAYGGTLQASRSLSDAGNVADLNRDGIVDSVDMCIMVDHWHTDEPSCDIAPAPFGDGIVDVQDLIVLAEHLFEGIPPVEPEEVNVDENDAGSEVELEQGQILVVTLESNPTTGYRWEQAETQESILQQMGEAEFKPSDTSEPPLVGAGGWEIFRFKAISAGRMILQLVYHRPWEEGVEPLETFSLWVVVR